MSTPVSGLMNSTFLVMASATLDAAMRFTSVSRSAVVDRGTKPFSRVNREGMGRDFCILTRSLKNFLNRDTNLTT